jgi:hypothetical protein
MKTTRDEGSASEHEPVHVVGEPTGERLHSTTERAQAFSLHDEVDVVALYAEVTDSEFRSS